MYIQEETSCRHYLNISGPKRLTKEVSKLRAKRSWLPAHGFCREFKRALAVEVRRLERDRRTASL